jgi:anthranilate phosphoribosyltransferase
MTISSYIKAIGRGKQGARDLSRADAAAVMGELLDGRVGDLAMGAFCIAMRVKGETPIEMAGFLDAIHPRLARVATTGQKPTVVIPSYNGARKLPLLTPLLALLLAQKGFSVLIHGAQSERTRVSTLQVGQRLGIRPSNDLSPIAAGQVRYLPLDVLHGGLHRLLMARFEIGLRNSAHSLVKLMNPVAGPAIVVSSYTHPEYLDSMTDTFALTGQMAFLSRGTEGESAADPRKMPRMDVFVDGQGQTLQEAQASTSKGSADTPHPLEHLPTGTDPAETAYWIAAVLDGRIPLPGPLQRQMDLICAMGQG